MAATDPTFRTRLFAIALAAVLIVPTGAVAATGTQTDPGSTEAVEFVRTSEEVRGYLLASAEMAADGNAAAASHLAAEPSEEHWAALGPALSDANESLASSLQADLEALPAMAENESAQAYEQHLRQAVFPELERAEAAVAGQSRLGNTTFEAGVVRDLLERSVHEYREGVSNGTVSDAGEYRVAQAFAERAEARYETSVAGTLTEDANAELTELFEQLHATMATPGASAAVERFVGSITAELGEYTGIEVDKSGSVAAIERIESDLESAVTAYENGSAERAKSIVKQTYLSNFEGVEGTLIEANPELVESLEAAFNDDLPGLIEANASASEVQNRVETMNSELETAEGILAAQESPEVSLDVEGTTTAPESTTAQPATTSTNAPGFTVVGALLALVGVGLLVRRR